MENMIKSASNSQSNSDVTNTTDLIKEGWYHGPIQRREAEELLIQEGDFLVRETRYCNKGCKGCFACQGRYVLTVRQSENRGLIHCLLNGQGVIGTQEKSFDSVSDLINYYLNSGLPIIPSKPEMVIKRPILKEANSWTTN